MKIIASLFLMFIFIQGCNRPTTEKRKIYVEDFKWTITIPEDFEKVSDEQWAKLQNKGVDLIEKTYDTTIVNQAKTIFVFKNDQLNYFESNYQPFDPAVDGDYLEVNRSVHDVLYESFRTQMPNIKIDTTSTVDKIDGLEFRTFKIEVEYPNKMVLNLFMFSRLFDKKEFSVNITYVDKIKGRKMLDAWRKSTFGK